MYVAFSIAYLLKVCFYVCCTFPILNKNIAWEGKKRYLGNTPSFFLVIAKYTLKFSCVPFKQNIRHILDQESYSCAHTALSVGFFPISSSDIEHSFQSTDLAIIAFQVCIMFIKFQYAIVVFQLLSLNLLSEKQVCYLFLMGKDLVSSWWQHKWKGAGFWVFSGAYKCRFLDLPVVWWCCAAVSGQVADGQVNISVQLHRTRRSSEVPGKMPYGKRGWMPGTAVSV